VRTEGRTVAVYGAGIAGLTAAHEFSRRGWVVSVYEAHSEAGGFFRSARGSGDHAMPSEYSWHGMGPWYHNVFDVMRQIPFDAHGSVYERALSRPIDFGVAPDVGTAEFDDKADVLIDVRRMFRLTRLDWFWWARLMAKEWTANHRSTERYATRNAAAQWGKRLKEMHISPSRTKEALTWLAATVGGLKLNGHVVTYSPLSRVVEIEALSAAVTAKLRLWMTLADMSRATARFDDELIARLQERAHAQLDALATMHRSATALAFGIESGAAG
jgi:uncharacterized protein with NAD-binding domain and iron-sulfur cluster